MQSYHTFNFCYFFFRTAIHICSERQGSAVMVQEGLPIEICCSIQRLVCQRDDSVSLMDSLTLLPEGVDESSLDVPGNMTDSVEIGVDGHFEMRRLDECHVELLVKNPSSEGIPLNLVCRFKGAVMESTPLRVVREYLKGQRQQQILVCDLNDSCAYNFTFYGIFFFIPLK